jgi:hypothetical protein
MVDSEPAIQIERLRYLLEQSVKEGSGATPQEWLRAVVVGVR